MGVEGREGRPHHGPFIGATAGNGEPPDTEMRVLAEDVTFQN